MNRSDLKRRLPGAIAGGLVILTTSLWTFWGAAEQRALYPNGPAALFRGHSFELVSKGDRVMLREGEEVLLLLRRR